MKTKRLAGLLKALRISPVARRLQRWNGLICLNYHRIGEWRESPYDRALWSATSEAFDEQVRFVKNHFDLISPADLPEVVRARRGRFALFTFDDGYADNYELAYPILRANAVTALFFLTTGFLDQRRIPWWDEIAWIARGTRVSSLALKPWITEPIAVEQGDREPLIQFLLRTFKSLRSENTSNFLDTLASTTATGRHPAAAFSNNWMTWEMVHEMRKGGMHFGAHTVNHPVLAQMPYLNQREEISGSCKRLAEITGVPTRFFSYPVGGRAAFNGDTRRCLREEGIELAFSYYGGINTFAQWDDLDIRRVAVEPCVAGAWFEAILSVPRIFANPRQ
jgi:peptidoglycan/xylan/chitin deacetylase (PgdA/CDA1 family)